MTKKNRVILTAVIAILIFGLSVEVLSRYRLKYVEVVGVRELMLPRSQIKEEDLLLVKLPRIFVDEETITDKEELVGQFVKLNHHLYPNKSILRDEVETLELSSDQALLGLGAKEKLFPMKAGPLESLGNMLRSGHKVDVYLRYSKGFNEKATVQLASSIRVLGLKDRKGEDISKSNTSPHTILLAIDEDEIEMFVRAQGEGELILTGSSGEDKTSQYFDSWDLLDDEL